MRIAGLVLASVLCAACGVSISDVNARPAKYYQNTVKLTGRIARMQVLPGDTLLELVDARGGRILVRSEAAVEAETGDWVRVKGIVVPEARVQDVLLYDVVVAEAIEKTRAPRLRDLM